jgi:hypothetical protein
MYQWPLSLLDRISQWLSETVDSLPIDLEEKERLYYFLTFLLLGIPLLLGFGIYNFFKSQWILGTVVLAMAFSLMLAWSRLKKIQKVIWLYRINITFYAGLLLFVTIIGGENGSKSLWLFTFPVVTFFLMSTIEGWVWTLALIVGAAGVLWLPHLGLPAHRYGGEFSSRFAAVYFILSIITFWFEYLRQRYQGRLEAAHQSLLTERAALQEALAKVKKLSGMLPICATCKKVRDDGGYWTQIEAYLHDHSEAEFTHGICPDCAKAFRSDDGGR